MRHDKHLIKAEFEAFVPEGGERGAGGRWGVDGNGECGFEAVSQYGRKSTELRDTETEIVATAAFNSALEIGPGTALSSTYRLILTRKPWCCAYRVRSSETVSHPASKSCVSVRELAAHNRTQVAVA